MILFYEVDDIIRIPENKLYCWQEVLVEGIHQRLKHSIVRDICCCITLKATAKCGQLYKDDALRSDFCIKVKYNYIVFKVMVGDLLEGTISKYTDSGLTLSFEYCHDIFVPFKPPTHLNAKLKYKVGDIVNFRITFIRFDDSKMLCYDKLENGTWFQIYGKIV